MRDISVAVTVLIIWVLLVRLIGKKHLSKTVIVLLWNLVILRALIPVQIPIRQLPFLKEEMIQLPVVENILGETLFQDPGSFNRIQAYLLPVLERKEQILTVWFVGVIITGFVMLVKSIREMRMMHKSKPARCVQVEKMIAKAGLHRKIRLYTGKYFASPVTCGVLRPKIILPEGFEEETEDHIRYIILHELVHIRRLDVLKRLGMTVAVCIYWFHPLMWLAGRLYRKDQEMACDEQVLRLLDGSGAKAYAEALVSMSMEMQKEAILYEGFQKKNAERERVLAAVGNRKMRFGGVAAAAVAILCSAFCFINYQPQMQTDTAFAVRDKKTERMQAEQRQENSGKREEERMKSEQYEIILQDIKENYNDFSQPLADEQVEAIRYMMTMEIGKGYLERIGQGYIIGEQGMERLEEAYPDRSYIKKK